MTHENPRKLIPMRCTDDTEKARLIAGIDLWIMKQANVYAKINGVDADDLIQVGRIHAWRAAELYDPTFGVRFLSYAARGIGQRMYHAAICMRNPVHVPRGQLQTTRILRVALDGPAGPDPDSRPLMEAIPCPHSGKTEGAVERHALLETAMQKLPGRLRRVIVMRFYEDRSLEEIGTELGVSRERARQLEREACGKLSRVPQLSELNPAAA